MKEHLLILGLTLCSVLLCTRCFPISSAQVLRIQLRDPDPGWSVDANTLYRDDKSISVFLGRGKDGHYLSGYPFAGEFCIKSKQRLQFNVDTTVAIFSGRPVKTTFKTATKLWEYDPKTFDPDKEPVKTPNNVVPADMRRCFSFDIDADTPSAEEDLICRFQP